MTGDTRRLFLPSVSFALMLFFFSAWYALAVAADYVCTRDGATREIAVVMEPGYACRVKYTKTAGTSYPWSALGEADYCGPKAAGLAERLGSFGWACGTTGEVQATVDAQPVNDMQTTDDQQTADDIQDVLLAQLERYGRYLRILDNVGKTCQFYPANAQYGNLCGDGYAEAAIVYTCEADGDTWEQHLAVFIDTEEQPLIREVGGHGSRQVTGYYFDADGLAIESEPARPDIDGSASGESATTTRIGCRYDAADRWELFEH